MKRPAVFIDFQGTLGGGGLDDIISLEFFPFSIKAIKSLNDNGILAVGITNQSHISKGGLTMEAYLNKLQALKDELSFHNAYFDAVYCCPHTHKDQCSCKKPLTGMIDKANEDFDIDMPHSYVIGDTGMSDIVLARNINAKGVLVLTGLGKSSLEESRHTWKDTEADHIADNVYDAVKWILHDINQWKHQEVLDRAVSELKQDNSNTGY